MHLLMNQWRSKEFLLHPYYATGGVLGGCVCCYLWDFGENWEVINLYDPKALREHVAAFLGIDLTKHFAFLPFTGEPFGPWYYINQEKIIFLIYYYVLHTGDTAFLKQKVHGRALIDHVIEQALAGDDVKKDAVLVDYGNGNHHLELRKEYRYDHYLPDMNARRYAYYYVADELCKLAGKEPPVDFPKRAEAIKKLVTKKMWNPRLRWYHWLDAKGKTQLRYTVQMFKLFSSGVLDPEQELGLLSHLNEEEFLSAYGLHSMAKHDPAYDQVDIDNGCGGKHVQHHREAVQGRAARRRGGYPAADFVVDGPLAVLGRLHRRELHGLPQRHAPAKRDGIGGGRTGDHLRPVRRARQPGWRSQRESPAVVLL